MRFALLLPVLLCIAAPAYAEGARESRYGPTTPRQGSAAADARYDGPILGWANKRQASSPVSAASPNAANRPAPVAAWAGYQPAATARAPVAQPAVAPAPAALPTSLYSTPRPAIAAAPARQTAALNAMPPGETGARFYSVGRESGLTPDPIPPAGPDHQVLITADAPQPSPEDATPQNAAPMHGSADWLAAGARGDDDDDDSAARRAKTRNEGL